MPSTIRIVSLYVVSLLITYGAMEAVSWLVFSLYSDGSFSFESLQNRRDLIVASPAETATLRGDGFSQDGYLKAEAVHPYIGFVQDPTSQREINNYGFRGEPLPLDSASQEEDALYVVVLGGSVAMFLVDHSKTVLLEELRRVKAFNEKKIFVTNLALGGLKQPQQLMTVNYFLSLGARIDLIINLDGFNEIVLPSIDNVESDTFPFYPRRWKVRVAGLADQDLLWQTGRIAWLEKTRASIARFFSSTPMQFSVTANVLWDRLNLYLHKSVQSYRLTLTNQYTSRYGEAKKSSIYAASGPKRTYTSKESQYMDLVAHWKRSSLMLHNIANGMGIHYFHFLQPNQYVPGSKILSEKERSIAILEGHHHQVPAREGYPYLIDAGRELGREGVNFTDLTMLFASNEEQLYIDRCCHLNPRGSELIAREISRVIRNELDGK